MFKRFRESLGENQPISWPLYIIFGYILLPMACGFSSMFAGILMGIDFNGSGWSLLWCGSIGYILGIVVTTIIIFCKKRKAKKDYITTALEGVNVIVDWRNEKFKFCYECPACGESWEDDNVPIDKLCPLDFLPLKEVDPIERDNFYDL